MTPVRGTGRKALMRGSGRVFDISETFVTPRDAGRNAHEPPVPARPIGVSTPW